MTATEFSRGARVTALASSIAVVATICAVAVPAAAQAASPAWRVLAATGPTNLPEALPERQMVTPPFVGGYTITFGGHTTSSVDAFAPPTALQDALNALPSINADGGSVSVIQVTRGSLAGRLIVAFDGGPLAGTDVPLMAINGFFASVEQAPSGELAAYATNVGGAPTTGTTSLTVGPLPAGVEIAGPAAGEGWTCPGASAGQTAVTCTRDDAIPAMRTVDPVVVPLRAGPSAAPSSTVSVSVEGGGAALDAEGRNIHLASIAISNEKVKPGVAAFWAEAFDSDGHPETQAGGHPNFAATMFLLNTNRVPPNDRPVPVGDPRDLMVDLPVGFLGNPLATSRCPQAQAGACSPLPVVGEANAMLQEFGLDLNDGFGISNNEPPNGYPAQFTFQILDARATVVASLRSDDDFGVTAISPNIPSTYKVFGASFGLQGSPEAAAGKALLTNPTECSGSMLPTSIILNSWQAADVFSDPVVDEAPAVTGCELVPFAPAMVVEPTSAVADAASGLEASIDVPQDGLLDPDGLATSHLKKTVVRLPEGLSVNPSGATGLKGCSDAQVGLKSKSDPSCPDGSKLGTVSVTSPLVDQPLDGVMYLGTPKSTDPMSGEMLRLFLVVRNDRYGILVKLPGSITADPQTGRLTATFDNNPRLPFDHLEVNLRGGSRGALATPQDCGPAPTSTTLSPWSGTADIDQVSPFDVSGNCGLGFAPKLAAGMDTQQARGSGTFSFRFSREDGEQWIDGLTAKLPTGLLASVKDVELCTDGQAAAAACPAGSRIGVVDATAGSGDPFVIEQKGTAYLTEGYKGCAYGLAVVVHVVAGPFDATTPETDLGDIVVRQKVCVDPTTAQVSATSDPLPTIWHGVPLRVRSVTVNVDRPGFMLNPSDCAAKQVGAEFDSNRGATAGAASPFNASGCAALPFKPKLTLALTGKKQKTTGKHPGVKATVTQQGLGEVGIEKAVVRLPKSLALDPNNAQALCEFADGTKPDLENHCPKGSIVGRARAKTPLLKNDLVGNVYFVKNIRIDAKTGNEIRTLPMIIVALRGEIAINLKGESSTTKAGKLVNTFANVPDAPISRFNLNIKGGRNGILAVTRTRRAKINLCAGRHIAEVDNDGQNGRRHDFDVRMKTPCTKRQTKNAKRAAKRAAKQAASRR